MATQANSVTYPTVVEVTSFRSARVSSLTCRPGGSVRVSRLGLYHTGSLKANGELRPADQQKVRLTHVFSFDIVASQTLLAGTPQSLAVSLKMPIDVYSRLK